MTEQELRTALKRSLSDELPVETRRAVLMRIRERKEPVVKNKLSVALILVLVLTLLSTVALAVTLSRQYFEDVAKLQFESGWYEDWGLQEKLAMVDILQEYGLISEEQAKEMDDEESIDAFMIERYGVEGSDRIDTIGIYSILDKELGEIHTWSLEQKAWYTDMMIRVGLLTRNNDDDIFAMPEASDIQPDQAIALAKAAVIEGYGLQPNALDAHQIDVSFETHASDWERKDLHYNIHFWGEGLGYYSCSLTRDGRIMDSTMNKFVLSPAEQAEADRQYELEVAAWKAAQPAGHYEQWSLADKAKWLGADNGIPSEGDISEAEAVAIAQKRLHDIGYDLSEHEISVWYKLYDYYAVDDSPQEPFYVVYFTNDLDAPTEVFSVIIDADSGEVLKTGTPDMSAQNG